MINAQNKDKNEVTLFQEGREMKKGFLEDSRHLSVKMSRSTRDELRKNSEKNGSTVSKTVRALIYKHLEMEAQEKAIAP